MKSDNNDAAPRPRRVPKKARTTEDLLANMDDNFLMLRRAIAGYSALSAALRSLRGDLPEGERRRGLPVFTFSATADGRDAVQCVVDLKKIRPEYVEFVLGPLIHAQGEMAREAAAHLANDLGELAQSLERSLAGYDLPPVPSGDAPAEEYEEVEE